MIGCAGGHPGGICLEFIYAFGIGANGLSINSGDAFNLAVAVLRVGEFEVATSGGIWVAIRGLTLEPSGAEGIQLGRPVKACPTSSQAAADARQRPELQCLNPQSDRGCCKENQVLGTYG